MSVLRTILFAVSSLGLLLACAEEPTPEVKPRLVRAIQIGAITLQDSWTPGQAVASREVELSFRVGGRMIERPVFVGDPLKKGDLVARIDPTDYELDVSNAEGNLKNAKANLRAAQAEYNRLLGIQKADPGAVSQSALDRGLEERDRAQANITSLEAVLDTAKVRLERTVLEAPFDGVVVARYAEAFEDIQPKQPIIRLVGTKQIEFLANLPEHEVNFLPQVVNMRVRFDAFPERIFPAQLHEIGAEASLTTRTFPVRLILDQPEDIKILPGMAGQATGDLRDSDAADNVVIPVSATFTDERGGVRQGEQRPTFVYVIDENTMTVNKRQVAVGNLVEAGITITDGLAIGEWVVTAGVIMLEPGQKIRLNGGQS